MRNVVFSGEKHHMGENYDWINKVRHCGSVVDYDATQGGDIGLDFVSYLLQLQKSGSTHYLPFALCTNLKWRTTIINSYCYSQSVGARIFIGLFGAHSFNVDLTHTYANLHLPPCPASVTNTVGNVDLGAEKHTKHILTFRER